MLFRRFIRRRRPPPPVVLPSLDRLSELVERVVELLDEVAVGPPREPVAVPNAVVDPDPHAKPAVRGHVLFASSPDGYRLFERDGPPPARGDLIEVAGETLTVLRFGPSPLPGDWRRCAYLEQEPPKVARTFDR